MARRLRAIAGALQAKSRSAPVMRRGLIMALSTLGFGWLLWSRIAQMDSAAVADALTHVAPVAWTGAVVAATVSFWAIGHYDETVHRHIGTGIPARQARTSGLCAIAVSQVLGLGLVTGALVRWRMLPSLTLWQAGRLTLAVSVMFLAGWAVVAAAAILVAGGPYQAGALVVMALSVLALTFSAITPHWTQGWPNLYTMTRMLGLAAVDCGAAAVVFFCLWTGDSWAGLLPVFLLAYGAGLLSGAPGGVGAFELTLLALLPDQAEAPILAAALAYRGVYFVMPALLAVVVVLLGPRPVRRDDVMAVVPGTSAFPEVGLMRQGVFQPLVAGGTLFAAARTSHALIALREPLAGGGGKAELAALIARAAREARAGIIYKAPPRLALAARGAGMAVLPLAREAWIYPAHFTLESPTRAALRRKLRKAAHSGVVAQCEAPQMAELARINAAWVMARGGEMGFSMGRFAPGYVLAHRVYVARIGVRPVGFATFHATASGWALDLLRPHPDAPDGTAHCLITAALADAARAGVPRMSLAAAPNPAFADGGGLLARLARWLPGAQAAAHGLYQFKSAFAPQWERLYLVAPNWPAMALAGWEIRRAILHPPPLAAPADYSGDTLQNEIASTSTAWQRKQG